MAVHGVIVRRLIDTISRVFNEADGVAYSTAWPGILIMLYQVVPQLRLGGIDAAARAPEACSLWVHNIQMSTQARLSCKAFFAIFHDDRRRYVAV